MAVLEIFIRASLAAILIEISMAANHIVGGPNGGWDTTSNLKAWASSQKFSVGDNLIFQYPPNHNVIEVTKADYDSCQPTNPIQSYSDGATTIPLSSPGKRYFICGSLGHCSQGMKLEIDTLASATSSTSSPTVSPSPAAFPAIPVIPSIESPESTNSPAESPVYTNSPVESPESTNSPVESPEYILAAPSPLFETHLDSPAFSPVIPSTVFPAAASPLAEKSVDPSAASAKKGNVQAFVGIAFSFPLMLLAF